MAMAGFINWPCIATWHDNMGKILEEKDYSVFLKFWCETAQLARSAHRYKSAKVKNR